MRSDHRRRDVYRVKNTSIPLKLKADATSFSLRVASASHPATTACSSRYKRRPGDPPCNERRHGPREGPRPSSGCNDLYFA